MCFDNDRFKTKVDENLICPICTLVLCIDFVQDEDGHVFCAGCIKSWLVQQMRCPISRQRLSQDKIKPVPLAFKGILCNYEICCKFKKNGCTIFTKLQSIEDHEKQCEFDTCAVCECRNTENHNCVAELKKLTTELKLQLKVKDNMNEGLKRELKSKSILIEFQSQSIEILRKSAPKTHSTKAEEEAIKATNETTFSVALTKPIKTQFAFTSPFNIASPAALSSTPFVFGGQSDRKDQQRVFQFQAASSEPTTKAPSSIQSIFDFALIPTVFDFTTTKNDQETPTQASGVFQNSRKTSPTPTRRAANPAPAVNSKNERASTRVLGSIHRFMKSQ